MLRIVAIVTTTLSFSGCFLTTQSASGVDRHSPTQELLALKRANKTLVAENKALRARLEKASETRAKPVAENKLKVKPIAKKKSHSREKELVVDRVWDSNHDYGYALVTYRNLSGKRLEYVSIQCTALDARGNKIGTNTRAFSEHKRWPSENTESANPPGNSRSPSKILAKSFRRRVARTYSYTSNRTGTLGKRCPATSGAYGI